MPKNIALFFEGTKFRSFGQRTSSIIKMATSLERKNTDGDVQLSFYFRGVGSGIGTTGASRVVDTALGGLFGTGMAEVIQQAYRQLVLNYENGDRLYIFGWSRGAFAAVRFCDLLLAKGIQRPERMSELPRMVTDVLNRDPWKKWDEDTGLSEDLENATGTIEGHWEYPERPLRINYLGLFDCVPAIGLPLGWNQYFGINKHLSRDEPYRNKVGLKMRDSWKDCPRLLPRGTKSFRHAIAADERSAFFEPYIFTNIADIQKSRAKLALKYGEDPASKPVEQFLFPGGHSALGGTLDYGGIGASSLHWIASGSELAGLKFNWDLLGLDPTDKSAHSQRITVAETRENSGLLFSLPGTLKDRTFDAMNTAFSPEYFELKERDPSYRRGSRWSAPLWWFKRNRPKDG